MKLHKSHQYHGRDCQINSHLGTPYNFCICFEVRVANHQIIIGEMGNQGHVESIKRPKVQDTIREISTSELLLDRYQRKRTWCM